LGTDTQEPRRKAITERMRVPLGSLVVDAALVFVIAWWGSAMQTRMEESRRADDIVHTQLAEQLAALRSQVGNDADSIKIAELEAKITIGERDRLELKSDINARLSRIEDKLDRALK